MIDRSRYYGKNENGNIILPKPIIKIQNIYGYNSLLFKKYDVSKLTNIFKYNSEQNNICIEDRNKLKGYGKKNKKVYPSYDSENGNDFQNKYPNLSKYTIDICGTSDNGIDIVCHVINWKPYFYIKLMDDKYINLINSSDDENISFDITEENNWMDGGEFNERKKEKFYKISSDNIKHLTTYFNEKQKYNENIKNGEYKYKIYDYNQMPIKFLHDLGIGGRNVIELYNFINLDKNDKVTYSPIEIIIDYKNIKKSDIDVIDREIILAFDIETSSLDYQENTGIIQYPDKKRDPVIAIGMSFSWSNEEIPFLRYVLLLGETQDNGKNEHIIDKDCQIEYNFKYPDKVKTSPVHFISCKNEEFLLQSFTYIMKYMRPGYILSYNGNGYDWKYMRKRSIVLGIENEFAQLSKYKYNSYGVLTDTSHDSLSKNNYTFSSICTPTQMVKSLAEAKGTNAETIHEEMKGLLPNSKTLQGAIGQPVFDNRMPIIPMPPEALVAIAFYVVRLFIATCRANVISTIEEYNSNEKVQSDIESVIMNLNYPLNS